MEAFNKLKEWWVIILFIGGLIIGWTNFDNRLNNLERTQNEQNPTFLQLQKDIVEIKTTLEYIKFQVAGKRGSFQSAVFSNQAVCKTKKSDGQN